MPEASRAAETRLPPKRCRRNSSPDAPTPREIDVLHAVISDERQLKQASDDLGISLCMAQRCLTSVYKKTDAQTCAGFTKEFMGGDKLD